MSLPPPVTNREREEMRRLRALHLSVEEIGARVGRSGRCVSTHVRDMGIAAPRPGRAGRGCKRTPAEEDRLLGAARAGLSREEIGARFRLAPSSVGPTLARLRKGRRLAAAVGGGAPVILTPFDPATLALLGAVLLQPQEPAVAAPARAPVSAPAPADDDLHLTVDEADRLLPDGDSIHVIGETWRGRWSRRETRVALHCARAIRLTLPATRAIGFGLSVDRRGAETVLVETDGARVRAWLAAQADRLARGK